MNTPLTTGNVEKSPVIVLAGGADVSPKGPDSQSVISRTLRKVGVLGAIDAAAKLGEYAWNKSWKLDMTSNALWMGELETYLKKNIGETAEIVHIEWSGSASLGKEKEAVDAMRKQLSDVAKKHPNRPIICIGKSLAGPYMVRALHEESGITITQFITLGSPWGRGDTIPDNIKQTTIITSISDVFQRVGNFARFGNFKEISPKMKNPTKEPPLEVIVSEPTHGGLNHDTPTGAIETSGEGTIPNALKNVDSMYPLLAGIIQAGLAEPRG